MLILKFFLLIFILAAFIGVLVTSIVFLVKAIKLYNVKMLFTAMPHFCASIYALLIALLLFEFLKLLLYGF